MRDRKSRGKDGGGSERETDEGVAEAEAALSTHELSHNKLRGQQADRQREGEERRAEGERERMREGARHRQGARQSTAPPCAISSVIKNN